MKLIDRYVVSSFLKNYLLSFLVLVGMYVVLDMIFNFDELVEINAKSSGLETLILFVKYISDYYFYQMFLYFAHLSGMIPVAAAAFTLMRMVRFNELSALLSAGVPLLRIAMPIVIAALFLNGLLWVDQELIIPNMIPKLIRKHDFGVDSDTRWFAISAMRDEGRGKLFASRYFATEDRPHMDYLSVVEQDENYRPVSLIRADSAEWDEAGGQWILKNGHIDRNLSPDQKLPVKSEPLAVYKSSITPTKIQLYRNSDFVEMLSTKQINELLSEPLSYGQANLLRVKHTRGVAQISINMILLLLSVSCVLTRDPQQLRSAAGRSIILCGLCMTMAFIGQEMGGSPPTDPALAAKWPALMAWLPIFTFGPLSVYLLDRVKT